MTLCRKCPAGKSFLLSTCRVGPRPAFDVVVVGARCAGSPLAALLARRGLSVAVVEQATFPSDTLSTHVFEADGLAFLDRLGVMDRLRATGAPVTWMGDARVEDFRWTGAMPVLPTDVGFAMSVRRMLLDPILADAAEQAGADILMATKVTRLVHDGGRVAGVRVSEKNGESELRARVVVGADGRNSTIAKLAGARAYNVTPNERAAYWAFFENADPGPEPAFVVHRWADRLVLAIPSDSGLYQVALMPDLAALDGFKRDMERSFMEIALSCEPAADALHGARRVGKLQGAVRWSGFFREAAGPGWVLVGDAGHFKDPAAGRGISDAFRQAETLSAAIADGLAGSDRSLDQALAAWGKRRDDEFAEFYWMAGDIGAAGRLPAIVPEIVSDVASRGELDRFFNLYNGRVKPSEFASVAQLLGVTGRLLRRRRGERRALLAEAAGLAADDFRRRRLNRRPRYAPAISPTAAR